jgi:prepilin-type N-terminal cleavage/methylation domain-containing protein
MQYREIAQHSAARAGRSRGPWAIRGQAQRAPAGDALATRKPARHGTAVAMPGRPSPLGPRALAAARRGFTLIEVLVVILILGILMALVVGVGKSVMIEVARQKTISIQALLVRAIAAYEGAQGAMPTQLPDASLPPKTSTPTDYGYNKNADEWRAAIRISDLYTQLMAEPASQKIILGLPPESVYKPTVTFRSDNTGRYKLFRDGFDNDMDYRAAGLGGRPVVISGGPDGHLGGAFDNDNISSDGRGAR